MHYLRQQGYIQISEDHTKAGAVNICEECGHIYNQNISSDIELQKFLDDEFMGDPGANSRKKKDKVEHLDQRQKMYEIEKDDAEDNLINDIVDLTKYSGRRWLEIRPRYFGLAEILEEHNIDYEGIDLFDRSIIPNIEARKRVKETRLETFFDPIKEEKYDVISNITVHILAHTRNPVEFIRQMTKQLKPGGEIIICEKDVRYIVHRDAPMPLEYPNCLGHMHHMTLESTINICNKVGLKITDYGYVKRRRH